MAIQLTEAAARHVEEQLAKRGAGSGLRIGTKKSGCSGFAYVIDYADETQPDDLEFESFGVKVVVDAASLPLLEGTVIDYIKMNALNEGFEFRNPNAKNECGCGESFST